MSGSALRKERPYAASDVTRPLAVQWPGPPEGFRAGPFLKRVRHECPEYGQLTPTQRAILDRLIVGIARTGQLTTSAWHIAGTVPRGNARRTRGGCTVRTVRTTMARIEDMGLTRSLEARNAKGKQKANIYLLGPVLFSLLQSGKVFTPPTLGGCEVREVKQTPRVNQTNVEVARKRRSAGQTAPRTVARSGGVRPVCKPGQPVPPIRGNGKPPELRQRLYEAIGGGRVFRADGGASDLSTLDERTIQKVANLAQRYGLVDEALRHAGAVHEMRKTGLRIIGVNLGILVGRELRRLGAPVPDAWKGRRGRKNRAGLAPIGNALASALPADFASRPEAEKTRLLQIPIPLDPARAFMAERGSGSADFTPPKTWKRS